MDYIVKFVFADASCKILDFKPYLDHGIFKQIKDPKVFRNFDLSNHTITWLDESVDFAPDTIYEKGQDYSLWAHP